MRSRAGISWRVAAIAAAVVIACMAVAVVPTPAQAGKKSLSLGIIDPWSLQSDSASENALWFDRLRDSRANIVLISKQWRQVAPTNPTASFDPTNPADPEYTWDELDQAVRNARARGLTPAILTSLAPVWAEGADRPSDFSLPVGPSDTSRAPDGTWKPNVSDLREWGEALARRYTGAFTDPDDPSGGPLPKVEHYQLWQEPNLGVYLNPRYENGKASSAIHYRAMIRAFWEGVHTASGTNKVITGGTSPYGDTSPTGRRTPPVVFWRDMLCLKGKKLKKKKCKEPAKFDITAHNAINTGPPRQKALDKDNAATNDLKKITRIVKKANKTGRVKPKGKRPLWGTEIWWDSNPPDTIDGVSLQKQARYLSEAAYLHWKQGASAVIWFLIHDLAPPLEFTAWSAGLYTKAGDPKPLLSAYRFPFAVDKGKKGKKGKTKKRQVWGIAPSKGRVIIERQKGSRWKKIGTTKASGAGVFAKKLRVPKSGTLRARRGSEASLGWKL